MPSKIGDTNLGVVSLGNFEENLWEGTYTFYFPNWSTGARDFEIFWNFRVGKVVVRSQPIFT